MKQTPIGERRHYVTLQNPIRLAPDGAGGFTTTWSDCTPAHVYARIAAPSAAGVERAAHATVVAMPTHVINLPYHPQLTTRSRVRFGTRTWSIVGVSDLEERQIEMAILAVELEGAAPRLDATWVDGVVIDTQLPNAWTAGVLGAWL